jgi:acetyl esterase
MSKAPPLIGTRIKLLFGLSRVLTALGLGPSGEKALRMPLARRRAIKPEPWMTWPIPASVGIRYGSVPVRHGSIPAKFFTPAKSDRAAPCILFIHGGGWVSGGYDSLDYLCGNVCDRLGVTVVAIEYRLAPDHVFPAAIEDCVDALAWTAQQHAALGSDRGEVVVMGDSAGGNLSAALCLHARDHGGPRIARQVLIYPALDFTLQSPSIHFDNVGLGRKDMLVIRQAYLGDADPANPLASPLLAASLAGLPPTLIQTADCDTLRDDGSRYAERLRQAGVPVQYENYTGMPHGYFSLAKLCAAAPQALASVVSFLRVAPGG